MILYCYNVLKSIEHRPVIYTGQYTLQSIDSYISGYYRALLDNGIVTDSNTNESFFDWIARKLDYYESTAGWVNMIVANSIGLKPKNVKWRALLDSTLTREQHITSIELFYKLLEEFKIEKNKV